MSEFSRPVRILLERDPSLTAEGAEGLLTQYRDLEAERGVVSNRAHAKMKHSELRGRISNG